MQLQNGMIAPLWLLTKTWWLKIPIRRYQQSFHAHTYKNQHLAEKVKSLSMPTWRECELTQPASSTFLIPRRWVWYCTQKLQVFLLKPSITPNQPPPVIQYLMHTDCREQEHNWLTNFRHISYHWKNKWSKTSANHWAQMLWSAQRYTYALTHSSKINYHLNKTMNIIFPGKI